MATPAARGTRAAGFELCRRGLTRPRAGPRPAAAFRRPEGAKAASRRRADRFGAFAAALVLTLGLARGRAAFFAAPLLRRRAGFAPRVFATALVLALVLA